MRTASTIRADHPRSRGVYDGAHSYLLLTVGSSPLARGLRREGGRGLGDPRIIPARAGFTPAPEHRRSHRGDHPRSRGVYEPKMNARPHSHGSSPLARGLPLHAPNQNVSYRIIPARAGFTTPIVTAQDVAEDHPRSRGVYHRRFDSSGGRDGSSPLARGLPGSRLGRGRWVWIIPARAGFTSTTSGPGRAGRDHPRSRGVY